MTREQLLAPCQNTCIRIRVLDTFTCRVPLLTKVKIEGNIEHQHPGEVLGEGHLFVGSQM